MKKKQFLIYPLLVVGLFLVFASSCNKEENLAVISTTEVTDITATTAESGGNITSDGGFSVTARGVCWSTSPDPTIEDSKTTDGTGGGIFTSTITGLKENTTYYVRAYATNKAGTSYGITLTFTTQQGVISGSFTDTRDGNVYNWVKIGKQVWMAENLKYLPEVAGTGTGSQETAYYYVYGYDSNSVTAAKATDNYKTYGVLYNWPAAIASSSSSTANPSGVQGVCPAGWHLPSDDEWTQLTSFLGGESDAGGKLKESGTAHWRSPNEGATNETGFTALPGGYRYIYGSYYFIEFYGYWWSATESASDNAAYRYIYYGYSGVGRGGSGKELGFSVRCVKD